MSGVDVLAVIRRHAESHRATAESDAYSAQEAPRLESTLQSIAELIEACRERDAAQTAWASSAERQRQEPGPFYQRSRAADARYASALAAVSPK